MNINAWNKKKFHCYFTAVETQRTSQRFELTSSSSSEVIEEVKQGSTEVTHTERSFIPMEVEMGGAPAKPARSSTTQVDHSEQMLLNSRPQRLHVRIIVVIVMNLKLQIPGPTSPLFSKVGALET